MGNSSKSKNGTKVIKAAMFGGVVGAAMGLLLAPKSGVELRQDLAVQAHQIGDKAQSAWQNVEDKTQLTVNTGKGLIRKGKRLVSNLSILVHEIRNGALKKTSSIYASEDMDRDDPTKEIMIIENEHEF
ncbi:YtxH domain-containing protein [Desulfosporosinus sp. BICA1-9]|uniref:YtxH domain-containing protein n=1 Tax=Desulfosporosinus sp. BICA1-9 TaxID=1531958 RepID=UPI000A85E3FE|nr:YtxH domain-containing protein [Desulfosporosinus sp. BICA1-9]KJS89133.1 MAG: hypothetical protein JL57_08950 [Desulfosporosinus sp. BICA1-9]HBW33949.1 YtxH domain-containing protein [Desulfosporosinus sp.]